MSLVALGLSHRSAPLDILESVALDAAGVATLTGRVQAGENISEAVVLATCNRVEIYAEASTFHGAVSEIGEALSSVTGIAVKDLREYLYVHYEDRAIAHLFTVACGLDSMAVGEAQILGQLREALRQAQEGGQVGSSLNGLFQQALRVGKRAHAETELDTVSLSLVETGLQEATALVGPLQTRSVLVVGAGAMSSLAAATVARQGARRLVVANRTLARAQRLAAATGGQAVPMTLLGEAIASADVVISCTGAVGHVIDTGLLSDRPPSSSLAIVDLALPRDVDPEVALLPGVHVVGLAQLSRRLEAAGRSIQQLAQVSDLVVGEVAAYLTGRRAEAVAPTVAALRSRAAQVVAAELMRLDQRLPNLSAQARAEVQLTVHRVVEKLLHAPTVRVKQLTGDGQGGDYAQALRELFDLDPHDVAAVSVPPETGPVLS